ncbi:Malic enzyme [Forsythia ovata]|uniref:Malic enzyme n=1 Tax=Forsythia ovata TaxID=205694 RepID=A0ABD1V153_9LAMI
MALQAVSGKAGPEADPHFFLLEKNGLITKERKDIDPAAAPFAKTQRETEGLGLSKGASLIEVVKKVKPHVLLGLSGVDGIINEEVLKAMRESDSTKPAIFAMSNPTANAECTALEAFKHAGEDIVFASGSPFADINSHEDIWALNCANENELRLREGMQIRRKFEHKDQLQTREVTNVNQLHRTDFSAWFHTKFCSFGVAAATVCIVVFGTRQKSKQQQKQKLQFQIYTKDKVYMYKTCTTI